MVNSSNGFSIPQQINDEAIMNGNRDMIRIIIIGVNSLRRNRRPVFCRNHLRKQKSESLYFIEVCRYPPDLH
ncbi:hypothetical protein GJ496_007792 [Pomphorhynchus laevis]|nr:hypothetical protein GJ496_007792 [Pomphorhynchus laevis]